MCFVSSLTLSDHMCFVSSLTLSDHMCFVSSLTLSDHILGDDFHFFAAQFL